MLNENIEKPNLNCYIYCFGLLPVLPDNWKGGEVKGLVARGGFVVDIDWKNNRLVAAKISFRRGRTCPEKYNDKTISITLRPGAEVNLDNQLKALR